MKGFVWPLGFTFGGDPNESKCLYVHGLLHRSGFRGCQSI
jgi:hypothetical protein